MTPTETVQALIATINSGPNGFADAIHAYFTPDSVWENVGMLVTRGVEETLAAVEGFEARMGAAAMRIDILAITGAGDVVIVERVDRLLTEGGDEVIAMRVVGVFEIENGRVRSWREYFDTAAVLSFLKQGG